MPLLFCLWQGIIYVKVIAGEIEEMSFQNKAKGCSHTRFHSLFSNKLELQTVNLIANLFGVFRLSKSGEIIRG